MMKLKITVADLIMRSVLPIFLAWLIMPVFSQTSHMVDVSSNKFTPDQLTISVGDTVIWVNSQGNHDVNGTQNTFPSNPESFGNNVGSGWTFSHVFTIPGIYDYRCDPHYSFGMVGQVEVQKIPSSTVMINLSGMGPHVGQEIYFALIDTASKEVIDRKSEIAKETFSVQLNGVEPGRSYHLDFFSDHNGNGYYDAPPVDHAWRLEINSAVGDEIIDFTHNTNFTDIMWKYRLRVHFAGMNPHIGQMLALYVRDLSSGNYLDTVIIETIEDADFDLESYVVEPGGSYLVDFYADHNGNGSYDAPPVDHAWRLETGTAMGDVDLEFTHNTNFTDISSPSEAILTVNFTGMTPHLGQTLWLVVVDQNKHVELARFNRVIEESFSVSVPGIIPGNNYSVEFFADHNGNGYYDAPPVDHAWRYDLEGVSENEVLNFTHNTNFTDIMWKYRLRVHFAGMNPHIGQMLALYVRDLSSGNYLDTVVVLSIEDADFDLESYVVEPGGSYLVDFYADHNGNGSYDAPPVDHAWRLETGTAMGDVDLEFTHNTSFTDIFGTTGLDPVDQVVGISIYPNPASDVLYIRTEEEIESVILFNATGSGIMTLKDIRSTQVTLSLEGVSSGIYFVEVRTAGQEKKIGRLVKQ